MRRRNIIILGVIATIVVYLAAAHLWSKHRRHQRQRQYEAALASYRDEFKPNTSRGNIESILRVRGIMPTHEPYGGPPLDDFIKLGREQDYFYCSRENIDIQFHFTPSEPGNISPEPTDSLHEITLGLWPYDCL